MVYEYIFYNYYLTSNKNPINKRNGFTIKIYFKHKILKLGKKCEIGMIEKKELSGRQQVRQMFIFLHYT